MKPSSPCPNKATMKSIKEANKFRKSIGMTEIKPKKRACMRCGRMFMSYSVGHRLCHCMKNVTDGIDY